MQKQFAWSTQKYRKDERFSENKEDQISGRNFRKVLYKRRWSLEKELIFSVQKRMRENEAHTEENSSDVKYKRCKNLFYGTGKQIKGT